MRFNFDNAHKTEYMCFKQKRVISTLSGNPLELVNQCTYLSSNISSTERDVNICWAKVWNTIGRLLKSDLSDIIKLDFL